MFASNVRHKETSLSLGGGARVTYDLVGNLNIGLTAPDPDGYFLQRYPCTPRSAPNRGCARIDRTFLQLRRRLPDRSRRSLALNAWVARPVDITEFLSSTAARDRHPVVEQL